MKLSIRRKLLIGFTLLLLLAFLIQGFSFIIIQQYISSQITSLQEVEANEGADDILTFFTDLNSESSGLSQAYYKEPGNFVTVAEYTLKKNDFIKQVTVLSALGHEFIKVNAAGQFAQDKLSYEVYSDPFKSAVAGTAAISQVYYIGNNSEPYIDTYYPVFEKTHKVAGVIKMQVNLRQLRNQLSHIRLENSGILYVVDQNGLLISHPSESYVLERPDLSTRKIIADVLRNKQPTFADEQYTNEYNMPVIAKAVKISNYNWVAVFEQSTSEAFSFLSFIRNLFIVTVGVSFVFLLLIALFLSENLTRPIRRLQQSAEQVEKGQQKKIIRINTGDEIESLSHSFASLFDQLLERELLLEQISSQLKSANEKLKALDKLKNEFVSVASHELRTPMTSIKSYLWMVLKGKGGDLNEKQKYYLERSYNSVDRLVRLVNDMLNISRIESGHITINFQSVDLHSLVQEVMDEAQPRATELGISVVMQKSDDLSKVIADPDKIKEVFFNLIGNSLKFTPKGGTITISFSRENTFIKVKIKDTGAGIAAEDIGKLFQKFGLLPGSYVTNQTTVGGTGLGLYICRSIIDLHHGTISAESPGVGKGTTFIFTLKQFNEAEFQSYKSKNTADDTGKVDLTHTEI